VTASSRAFAGATAAILAGGLGTRLRGVVADRPKVLAEVLGRPFLAFLLDQLEAAGVARVVLCTGYRGEQVRAAFGTSYGALRLAYSQEPGPLGTGGALRMALPLLPCEPVLVMNGDSYCSADFQELWSWHLSRAAEATLLLSHVSDTTRYGRVQVQANGQVLRFDEKADAEGPGWISAGIYLLGRSLMLEIPQDRAVSLEREVFPAWIGRGLYGHRSQGRLLDIGTPESYAAAEQFFASRCEALAPGIPARELGAPGPAAPAARAGASADSAARERGDT
jgi:NDP-sugar pyrophosphorylase family protein